LRARAIPGVEVVDSVSYRRTIEIDGYLGSVEVGHLPQRQSLNVTIRFPNVRSLPAIVTRVRRLFDVGADIETIESHLSRDPLLAPLVARRPGLRAPGGGMALSWLFAQFSASKLPLPLPVGWRRSSLCSTANLCQQAMEVS
jgi:3-methyladenine DNA glycosylase/8-oxoguanine DNA glycosylase